MKCLSEHGYMLDVDIKRLWKDVFSRNHQKAGTVFFSLLPTFGLEWMFNLLGEDNDKWQVEGAKTDLNVQQVKLADKTDWVQDPMRSNYCGINI